MACVEKFAATKGRAESALKQALVQRAIPARSDSLRPEMTLLQAGEVWMAQIARPDSNLAARTRQQYTEAFHRYVTGSAIQGLTLREMNRVAVLERYLQGVADQHGTGAAKTARSVVSNIIGLAVRYQVLDFNAMRDVRPAKASTARKTERDTERAFTRAEREHVLAVARVHPGAVANDVSDLIAWLAGTGVRMGEALGQLWADVDIEARTALVRGTKSKEAFRTVHLPDWLAARMQERARSLGSTGLLFPSPRLHDKTKLRNRRNSDRVVRQVLTDAGFPWATGHTFRRTAATLMDRAGLPISEIATHLGHSNPALTMSVYLDRKKSSEAAAAVL